MISRRAFVPMPRASACASVMSFARECVPSIAIARSRPISPDLGAISEVIALGDLERASALNVN